MIDGFQAYRHIFLPCLSTFNGHGDTTSETMIMQWDAATSLHLNGCVTPWSIAYIATQVSRVLHHSQSQFVTPFLPKLVFCLNRTWVWTLEHAGFHYPSFYNFIVDYLEDHDINDKDTTQRVNALLVWWNR